ncbi:MAG TPA: DUF3892 domain-containing protein [Aestuariivirga sp.]|nr:DUF3892 domain-containing protein [Aestuariivirga sp.]
MAKNEAQITCINKQDRFNPYEAITHVGGYTNQRWKITQKDAINHIESGEWAFWVEVPKGDSVWVEVKTSRFGNKYIKTTGDGDEPNNLLRLPECPA